MFFLLPEVGGVDDGILEEIDGAVFAGHGVCCAGVAQEGDIFEEEMEVFWGGAFDEDDDAAGMR